MVKDTQHVKYREEKAAYMHRGVGGALAGMLAEHETRL